MRHARQDYNRIQDPAGIIPHDEPVFLLRAQDITAPHAVRAWARAQWENKGNRDMGGMAMEHADRMEEWQRVHGAKVADLPRGDVGSGTTDRSGISGLLDQLIESIGYAQAQVAATCEQGHDLTPPTMLTNAIDALRSAIDAVQQRLQLANTPANAAEGTGMRPATGMGAFPEADPTGGALELRTGAPPAPGEPATGDVLLSMPVEEGAFTRRLDNADSEADSSGGVSKPYNPDDVL